MSRLPVASPGPADTEGPGISAEALIALRTDMFRFAQLQLRNRETAEDMVQEAIDHLPANTGRVFMMREFLGLESDEICAQLSISTSNCHVILHRARLKLRACLGNGWARMGDATC